MSQVYGYIKQSGGHVKLYSEPALGTTVKLYLPKALATESPGDSSLGVSRERVTIPTARSGETVLVVEDDNDVRDYTVSSLRELGYRVFEAPDAAVALDLIRKEPAIRLLFTDLGLPGGMDGKELAERAREIRPLLKVLITTAYAASVLVHDGRLDSGVELLNKPFSFTGLAMRIRELFDHGASA